MADSGQADGGRRLDDNTRRGESPGIVPAERDRPRQGLVGVRRVRLLILLGEPRHPGDVLQPGDLRVRPGWIGPVGPGPVRGHDDVPVHRLCGADRRHAAGRRRLRLADTDLRRRPGRHRRGRGRRAHGLPRRECVRHSATPIAIIAGVAGVVIGAGPRHGGGAGSASSCPARAGGSSSRCGRRSTATSSTSSSCSRSRRSRAPPTCSPSSVAGRHVHRLDHHDRHRLGCGRPGHGRLCPGPAGQHLHRPHRPGRDVRPHDRLVTGHVQDCLRSGRPEPVRCLERLPGDDRQRGRQRRVRSRAARRSTSGSAAEPGCCCRS